MDTRELTEERIRMTLDVLVEHGLVCETGHKSRHPTTGTFEPHYRLTPKGEAATKADFRAVDRETQRKWSAARRAG